MVDGNLVPNQITIHMMGSVTIVLLLLALRARNDNSVHVLPTSILRVLVALLVAVVVQIFFGTQTRELVDTAVDHGIVERLEIIPSIEQAMPRIHRSFAWIVILLTSALFYLRRAKVLRFQVSTRYCCCRSQNGPLEWVLYFLGLPKAMQPVHLVLSIGILASINYPLSRST